MISGNTGTGVDIRGGRGTTVLGNKIGTDATGDAALPNSGSGVVDAGLDTVIGGQTGTTPDIECAGPCNLISSNGDDPTEAGIVVSSGDRNAKILGNYIGVDRTGGEPLPNANGILVNGAVRVLIGGTDPAAQNVIAQNAGSGVAAVAAAWRVTIRGNWIDNNSGLGIDLGADGPTANDTKDPDAARTVSRTTPPSQQPRPTPAASRSAAC